RALILQLSKSSIYSTKPKQVSKPLTVRMFAESARAGHWLYD
ncbi:DUF1493 family protein, partial [Citrobacter portucalensis]